MAIVKYIFYAALFLALITEGMSQPCAPDSITIDQQGTGKTIKGKTEFQVIVINICDCPQTNVTLDCDGFQTVENIDPNKVTITDTHCILQRGSAIVPSEEFDFNYAWDEEFPFSLLSAVTAC